MCFLFISFYIVLIVCSGSVRIEIFISFMFIIRLESLAQWEVNYFPWILVLFCEFEL